MQVPVRVHLELGGAFFAVRTLTGAEAASSLGALKVRFFVDVHARIDPDAWAGEVATLVIARGAEHRTVRRVVTRVTRGAAAVGDRVGAPVELTLVSRLDTLRFTEDLRVFRNKDIPSIVCEVLGERGIATRRALNRSYPSRPYVVAWRESYLDFVTRLLAEEGIFSVVDDDDAVVLGDSPGAYDRSDSIAFHEASGLDGRREAVFEVGTKRAMGPGKITFRDFDFQRPSLENAGSAKGSATGPEVYVYPGKNDAPAAGDLAAANAAEALHAAANLITGASHAIAIRPGIAVAIEGSPLGDLDVAMTRVLYDFDEAERPFSVRFEGVDASRTYRPNPLSLAAKPGMPQLMVGFVVGPAGSDIHTDEWGRVKVHFPWDRRQAKDDDASDWIPTLQDNTGHSVGIPRVGWEVLVGYLEGDPDRPVILGRLFNPLDPLHVTLPEKRMFTALRSISSPRNENRERTGENEILFDDTLGEERISMLAERDRTVEIEHDRMETTFEVDSRDVGRDEVVEIGHDRRLDVGHARSEIIGHDRVESVGANRSLKIGRDSATTVGGDRDVRIGGAHVRRVGQTDTTGAKNLSETIGALALEATVDANSSSASRANITVVGGVHATIAGATASRTTGRAKIETIGALLLQKAKREIQTRIKGAMVRKVAGSLTATAGDDVAFTAPKKLTLEVGSLVLRAKERISFTVGETKCALEKATIDLDTKDIKAFATSDNRLAAKITEQIP
ncbi:MAG: type VI secretion system tip protein TssI/VgrG [Polyangiaceae bacterium]